MNELWWQMHEELMRVIDDKIEADLVGDEEDSEQARLDIIRICELMQKIDLTATTSESRTCGVDGLQEASDDFLQKLF